MQWPLVLTLRATIAMDFVTLLKARISFHEISLRVTAVFMNISSFQYST